MLDPAESPHKVEVPVGAAKLAVGDKRQAGILLLGDELGDALVLDPLEPGVVERPRGMCGTRLFKRRGRRKLPTISNRVGAMAVMIGSFRWVRYLMKGVCAPRLRLGNT